MRAKRFLALLLVMVSLLTMVPTAFAAEEETVANKTVTINYVFEDGTVAANPWTGSLAVNESFSDTIANPEVTGYVAGSVVSSVGADVVFSAESLQVNITSIQNDITINVTYVPAIVEYTVKYFQQNVEDDNYTLAATVTQYGLTGDVVEFETADGLKTGFYILPYEEPVIAADGSTEVEVYMDRNYYLMTFDLGGGYGVEPVFARYGATIGDVGTPTRPGYTFIGWDVGIPDTMPAYNSEYKAVWDMADTAKVTVVFWGENANDESYSYIGSEEISTKSDATLTYTENGNICGLEAHTHDSDCAVSCGKTAHTHGADCYTLTCTDTVHAAHTDDCYTCNEESHTHSTSCYAGVGNQQNVYTGVPENPSEGYVHDHWAYGELIYIKGSWYRYSGSTSSGNTAPTTCGKTESTHTHTDSCLGDTCPGIHTHTDYSGACYDLLCTAEVHAHSADCGYSCGYIAHVHTDSCKLSSGLDSNLWTFVRSDTVTVNPDGSTIINVYYDRVEYTITFYDGDTKVYTIQEKWGADLSDHWPIVGTNGTTYNSGERWNPSGASLYNQVLVFIAVMPQESFTLKKDTSSYSEKTMDYYVEVLPGETGTEYDGKTFKKAFDTIKAQYGMFTGAEDFFDLEGFTQYKAVYTNNSGNSTTYTGVYGQIDISDSGSASIVHYYTRNQYAIEFYSPTSLLKKTEGIYYQASLSGQNWTPEASQAPSQYEPGSVVFEGWYLNPECTGEKFDFATSTMPAATENGGTAITLYAKWTPVNHTVKVYTDSTMTEQISTETVAHREFATEPTTPTNGNYEFVGWFYKVGTVEKAFDFASMPITKDMEIYAKWSSKVFVDYIVNYELADGTVIADPTTGKALGGTTKTFDAKGGEDLYTAYQTGYFPTTSSHSMTMVLEGTNEFTFVYVEKDAVPYTVRYLEQGTDVVLEKEKVVSDNRYAVVTETAVNISGYMPTVYQQRLVVIDGGENVLTFYYVKDEEHALVTDAHYLVNGGVETPYSNGQFTGTIGNEYTEEPLSIDGYVFDHVDITSGGVETTYTAAQVEADASLLTETLAEGGLHYEFYYRYNRFAVYYQSTGSAVNYDLVDSFSVTNRVHNGYLYGGMYTNSKFTIPATDVKGNGLSFVPEAGETYYVKEVPETYLRASTYYIYDTHNNNKLVRLYMITAIDDLNYAHVGFDVDSTQSAQVVEAKESVYETVSVQKYNAKWELAETRIYNINSFFGKNFFPAYPAGDSHPGYLHVQKYEGSVEAGELFDYTPFFVTPDGVKVTGVRNRVVSTGDGTAPNEDGSGLTVSESGRLSTTTAYANTNMAARLTLFSSFNVMGNPIPDPVITKVDAAGTTTQTVDFGDCTGEITYAEKSGQLFAGWYLDSALTQPADFSDVREDMTVYAKYIKKNSVVATVMGKKSDITASVMLPVEDFAEVGIRYTFGEESGSVELESKGTVGSKLSKLVGKNLKQYVYMNDWSLESLSHKSTFKVTPYWVTADGTVVDGRTDTHMCLFGNVI